MKKLFLIIISFFCLFLLSCDILDIQKEEEDNITQDDGSKDGDKEKEDGKTDNANDDSEDGKENQDDPTDETGNGDGGSEIDQNESLSFKEDDFKVEIVITNKGDNKKIKFEKEKYLEFFTKIKDFTYEKYGQCTSCDKVLYSITYGDNVIDVYEYNFFKINDVLYELTSGSFDFLKEYEYSNSESSGWLPWI